MAKRLTLAVLAVTTAITIAFLILAIRGDHWLFHPLAGRGYQFYSGIAGTTLFTAGIWTGTLALLRRHNCHAKWCWRLGRHAVPGTSYVVCRRHHPRVPDTGATAEHIHAAYHRANGSSQMQTSA